MRRLGLFANCKLVKGANRHVICDLQRGEVYFISSELYDILTYHIHKSRIDILSAFEKEYHPIIKDYLVYLESENLIFWDEEPEIFQEIDLTYEYPGWINNAIIERNQASDYDLNYVIQELTTLGCQFIELRFYDIISYDEIINTVALFEGSIIRNITLIIHYSAEIVKHPQLQDLPILHQRLGSIIIHSAPAEEQIHQRIKCTTTKVSDNTHCGKISPSYFSANLPFYSEAQSFNTCLNKKVSISPRGEIMNCPSIDGHYGVVGETKLETIVTKPIFQKLWGIHKDQIDICKDCEFRYVCSDCRAFLSPDNIFAKPKKCNYDPYTATWKDGTNF